MLKKLFVRGIMDLDSDNRMLPNGVHREALNIEVVNSEGEDVGVIEKSLSNKQLTNLNLGSNVDTIGKYEDEAEDKIYWFVKSDTGCYLIEWDDINKVSSIVLSDTRTEDEDRVLNLKSEHLITGIVKIISEDSSQDLLGWTDNNIEPCIINIERAKTWGENNFSQEDIYWIKKQPKEAPTVTPTYSSEESNYLEEEILTFGYRYRYLDGQRSAISSYSNYNFTPKSFEMDYQSMENKGMVNSFNAVRIGFNTGEKQVTDIEIVFKKSNSNTLYLINSFNKEKEGWSNDKTKYLTFSNNKSYAILPEKELFRTFDNVPRKAKALALIKNIPVFGNYVLGYDTIDSLGGIIKMDFNLEIDSEDVASETFSNSVNENEDLFTFNIPNTTNLKEGNKISLDLKVNNTDYSGSYEDTVDFILPRDYTDASDLASDEDFIFLIETVLTGDFLANYDITIDNNWELKTNTVFEITSSTSNSITIKSPVMTYTVDDTPSDTSDNPSNTHEEVVPFLFLDTSTVLYSIAASFSSLKSNRNYEVGLIYQDKWGRKSTVLPGDNNSINVPQKLSTKRNRLLVNILHKPPYWAETYKIAVKSNPLQYYTIFSNIFYEEGLFRWVKLEGANIDKVKEGDSLIVKSDLGGPLEDIIKVRVLAVERKEKNFIEANEDEEGNEIIEDSGLYMKIKPNGFDMNITDGTIKTFEGGHHRRFPPRTYTSPYFGETVDGTFKHYKISPGATIKIYIKNSAKGSISYSETFEKTYKSSGQYDSVKDWFEAEVEDLGSYGDDYTWDGVRNIWDKNKPPASEGYLNAGPRNKLSGWGFTDDGKSFFVRPHRKGTASRSITTTVRFEIFFSEGTVVFETEPKQADSNIFYESAETFNIENDKHTGNVQNQNGSNPAIVKLDFFNCFSQGNGVESYRVRDAVNANYLNVDLKPTTTSIEPYKEVRYFADLTFGEAFVESSNLNGLNVFNASTANWKELDKQYNSIQFLFSRDTNLIVFREDKTGYILFGKDLLAMADGQTVLNGIPEILGGFVPYQGDNGVGKNPESISWDAYRMYYVAAKRGTPIRLSIDGTTEINYGLVSFFRDLFINNPNSRKIGGYDPYHKKYVLTSEDEDIQVYNLYCGNTISKDLDAPFPYVLNINNLRGDVSLNYNISNGSATIQAVFDGVTNVVSNATGTGVLTFNRSNVNLSKVYINITPVTETVTVSITNNCPVGIPMNITSIVLADEKDIGKNIINRFKSNEGIFYSENHYFENEEISLFNKETGIEGIGKFPNNGDTVTIQSFKDAFSTAEFNETQLNQLGYLITDVDYNESDIETIKSLATYISVTETKIGENSIINSGDFNFTRPTVNHNLYLIWDYKNKNEAPVAVDDSVSVNKGDFVVIDVIDNDTDADNDDLTPIIVTQPTYGSLVINPDKTITYTHNNSEQLSDSFTYKVTDGIEESNIANVDISVGVDCSGGINASGSVGIYEAIVVLGTDTGNAGIVFDAIGVPDRFQIEYDGAIVADSKYVGDSMGGSPPSYSGLVGSHNDLTVYSFNGSSFEDTGTTRNITVDSSDVSTTEPADGNGTITFNKTTKTPTTMKIIVTAPIGSTSWNFQGICPVPENQP